MPRAREAPQPRRCTQLTAAFWRRPCCMPAAARRIPLTDQELGDKVRGLVNAGGFASSADDMIAAVWQLDTFDSLTSLLHTLPAQ